jgi:hypothetical protein
MRLVYGISPSLPPRPSPFSSPSPSPSPSPFLSCSDEAHCARMMLWSHDIAWSRMVVSLRGRHLLQSYKEGQLTSRDWFYRFPFCPRGITIITYPMILRVDALSRLSLQPTTTRSCSHRRSDGPWDRRRSRWRRGTGKWVRAEVADLLAPWHCPPRGWP